ncbi:hypothetical protein B7463_g7180, partial [Scytalidium lignicola]
MFKPQRTEAAFRATPVVWPDQLFTPQTGFTETQAVVEGTVRQTRPANQEPSVLYAGAFADHQSFSSRLRGP